jgi:phosphotransferase system enzyme I (PtsP)
MSKLSGIKLGVTTLEDISTLILQSHDLDETLNNIVALVARRTTADVCSIYLLDENETTLRLCATRGLSPESVGQVTMELGEGLTGLVVEERRVVATEEAQDHPRYRYFQETGEEQFHSFLGIPLLDRKKTIGVLVIQTREPRSFTAAEISTLSAIAFQVASIVINARLLDFIHQKEQEAQTFALALEKNRQALQPAAAPASYNSQEGPLRGTVAYPGLTSGSAHVMVDSGGFADFLEEDQVDPDEERQRIEQALEKTRIQTIFLEKRVAERLSPDDASIFHTHLMILEDRAFLQRIQKEIEQGHCAAYALKKVVNHYINAFERMDDPYLRERAADMKDIGRRLAVNLSGREDQVLHLKHPGILIAKEILPSDMASLDHEQILGIVTESGEKNSHAVIMAKSLGIPALVGVKGVMKRITPEETVILDANSGCLYASPPPAIIEEYSRLEEEARLESHRLEEFAQLPAITKDGTSVVLRANIGLISDMAVAQRNGAEGVGLYRTEFPYMIRGEFPTREEQYRLYARVVEGFGGQPVTIRTLDIGGDKGLPYFSPPPEENPFMGWRSVRVSLDNRDIFRTQMEAILMASVHGPVKLLFPMISGIEEIRACHEVIAEARHNLSAEGIKFAEQIPVGVMIEVPAAVTMAAQLAKEVDFFALGTNDLIQYMLAADRNNPLVSKYYDPLHPAILRVLHQVSGVARKQQKGLCLCGEMASDPAHFLLLLGMGIREFSMAAPFIPRIKALLRDLSLSTAEKTAKKALTMMDSAQIRNYLQQVLNNNLLDS